MELSNKGLNKTDDIIKINCDAAFSHHSNSASTAAVLRSANGDYIKAFCSKEDHSDIFLLEALAIKKGLLLALEYGFCKAHVESDNATIISAIKNGITPPSCISIVDDILLLSNSFSHLSFSFISRDSNLVADCLAKYGLNVDGYHCFPSCPDWLSDCMSSFSLQ